MKKFLIISSFIIVILAFSIVGYKVVSANEEIDEIKDDIIVQEELESYLTPYGYTFNNPNIVLNPYGVSPLTAMILFETEKEEEITIKIEGKDYNSTYINTFEKETKHYIPIYGLYPNTVNKIYITCGKDTKTIEIKTNSLPDDFKIQKEHNTINNTNKLTFISSDNYPYAIDSNNEVRWYLTKKYFGQMNPLSNGHFLIGNDSFYVNKHRTGVLEIDLLGKIYKQYNLQHGYYDSYVETDTSIFILSNSLIEFDKLSGTILRTFALKKVYNNVSYDKKLNMLILSNDTNAIEIDLTSNKENKILKPVKKEISNESILSFYTDKKHYKLTKGVKFTNITESTTSKENIFLIGYKKPDDIYDKYKINLKKTSDFFQFTGKFNSNQKVYLILDKFLDKRVYDMIDGQVLVHSNGLNGKYSIYIKIDNIIYKTNHYLNF